MKSMIIGLLLIGLFGSLQVHATDLERNQLAGLVKEIDFLLERVEAIRTDAPDQSRLHFQYGDLRQDLLRVREGISDYIDTDLRVGRDITPIQGSYR